MNGYERIMHAIAGEATDRTPVWPFVMTFAAKYAGVPYGAFASDYRACSKALIQVAEDFDLDAITVDSDAYREASACGAELQFPEDDLPVVVRYAITDRARPNLTQPNIESSRRLVDKIEGVRAVKSYFGQEKAVAGWIEAPLQSAGTLYPMDNFMLDIMEEPEFIDELVEFTTELGIRFAVEQVRAGADIIGVGDAMASLVSPAMYREHFLPSTKKLVQSIKAQCPQVRLKYHICGSSAHLLPFAKEIGFDLVNIDYAVDAAQAFAAVGDALCIKGNINPVTLLQARDPEEIRQLVRPLLALHQPKFILSPGCEVPRDTPPENFRTFVESVKMGD